MTGESGASKCRRLTGQQSATLMTNRLRATVPREAEGARCEKRDFARRSQADGPEATSAERTGLRFGLHTATDVLSSVVNRAPDPLFVSM